MRRAGSNVAVLAEDGQALLSFGYDHCAEHEWGIKGLRRSFGISADEADLTVQRFAVTPCEPGGLHLVEAEVETTDYASGRRKKIRHRRLYLLGGRIHLYDQTIEEFASKYHGSYPKPDAPEAFWDERAFMFSVPIGGKEEKVVRAVHAALLACDALIYQAGSRNPFGGAGLVIVRRSTIPAPLIAEMEAGFRDSKALKDAAEATGIRDRVEAWHKAKGARGAPFYALSPRWAFKDERKKTKHPVVFWLNPYDQERNNYGWFTVENLDDWIAGHGPIPKQKLAGSRA